MRSVFSILALISAIASAEEQPAAPKIDFKGVAMGASQAELLAAHPDFRCSRDKGNQDEVVCGIVPRCFQSYSSSRHECEDDFKRKYTYGGEATTGMMASFFKDRLESVAISFEPKSYAAIRDAVARKFGEGQERTETMTTRMGVRVENAITSWTQPSGGIRVRRYGSRIDEGLVMILSKEYVDRLAEKKQSKAGAAPADL